ncbi:MAG: hypothetical protein IPH07_15675 [Deltaproteobacteria bacterium]|nr:hypothetical protein [Deltaproteobacteria bacterium]MBK8719711.1 hypothetical protein [Deltaproteobacteria bacterium]MBP7288675.1 hypothetical protein [Nannocystaceae bacterium]
MSDPYRIEGPRSHEALLAEERALLVGAGKVMRVAGVIGLVAAVVGLLASYRADLISIALGAGLPGLLSALTLQAGMVLSRLPGGSRDYREIERAVGSLHVVYAIKGVIVLLVGGLFLLVMLAPIVLRLVR